MGARGGAGFLKEYQSWAERQGPALPPHARRIATWTSADQSRARPTGAAPTHGIEALRQLAGRPRQLAGLGVGHEEFPVLEEHDQGEQVVVADAGTDNLADHAP